VTAVLTRRRTEVALRTAEPADAPALHALIAAHLDEGRLLPRALDEIALHADRFVVATRGERIIGCGDLAGLSPRVAEVRSLAVDERERRHGVGACIVGELRQRARQAGYEQLCAFTHAPAYFIHMGFSIVPHLWLLEKVTTDCVTCAQFQTCGQYAMVTPLGARTSAPSLARGITLEPVADHTLEDAGAVPLVAGCA
jgi:amino-acid N-acetyltransferase